MILKHIPKALNLFQPTVQQAEMKVTMGLQDLKIHIRYCPI